MNTKSMASIRLEEGRVEQEVPPQVEQVPQGAQVHQVTIVEGGNDDPVVSPEFSNRDIRVDLLALV